MNENLLFLRHPYAQSGVWATPRVKGQPSLKVWVANELAKAKKGLTLDELIEKIQAAGYKSTSGKFKT